MNPSACHLSRSACCSGADSPRRGDLSTTITASTGQYWQTKQLCILERVYASYTLLQWTQATTFSLFGTNWLTLLVTYGMYSSSDIFCTGYTIYSVQNNRFNFLTVYNILSFNQEKFSVLIILRLFL